ncbi:hypothetical protein SAMN05428642_103521 [Flaviramulus basaltis]|uniref:Uncharacterized protein n=1 Tax=Flaviramulus basaltis TaxID=369401 RepID=A0A1K2IP96_9FLAO|nr:glycosyltransferase [Flaviramulus basaltis]SFZ94024.1 hypothetical protein SAMN05428642_103521 [Flaviramulus basaltis]
MNIIFICGSLEQGKDGVGDYTRRLCGELIKQGVSVGMLAYNDKHINNKIEALQISESSSVPCLRLPHTWNSNKRCIESKKWVDFNNPEWISLQFVPYSFEKKGLPLGLANQLKKIGTSQTKWHIMFHELWLGLNKSDSLKNTCIGKLQKFIIKFLVKKLNFNVVNTQSQLYLNELNNLNFDAKYLPLHGNIPFMRRSKETSIVTNKNKLLFVVFGSVRKGTPLIPFVEEFVNYFKSTTNEGVLLLVGRSGEEQQKWAREFEKYKIEVSLLGEMNEVEISNLFQSSNYGITTTPLPLIEKSGAVAAMREHGLPIIIVSKSWVPKSEFLTNLPDNIMEYCQGNFSDLMKEKIKTTENQGVIFVAKKLISYLYNNTQEYKNEIKITA